MSKSIYKCLFTFTSSTWPNTRYKKNEKIDYQELKKLFISEMDNFQEIKGKNKIDEDESKDEREDFDCFSPENLEESDYFFEEN